ncbi:phosphatidylserine decarboxylase 1 [Orobanche hederae]
MFADLEEAQLPLKEYVSLRELFVRMLREGARSINFDPYCLVSPVDGTILRFGELRGPGAMIEQVKGCSYRASYLLGANSHLSVIAAGDAYEESDVEENNSALKGLFYFVIYLKPADYHRIHSPVDWNILVRRHFTGHLFGNLHTQKLVLSKWFQCYAAQSPQVMRTELKLSTEYIVGNPLRLKLAATILCGVKNICIKSGSCVLIIGDICEITISHLSDPVGSDGLVYVVGFSGAVVYMVEKRPNVVTIFGELDFYWKYRMVVGMVDVIFAEIVYPQ